MKLIKDIYRALRLFSLSIAFISTACGIVIAIKFGHIFEDGNIDLISIITIILTLKAGLLIQAGVNLVNDYFEGKTDKLYDDDRKYLFLGVERTKTEIIIFLVGIACFGIAALIGLLLVIYFKNITLLIIGIIGLIGGYAYTGYPFNYKDKGLGALFSFILMGPLMVVGSYCVFGNTRILDVILLSLPFSFLIPALLFSNEIRDYEKDAENGIKTFSVRFGLEMGRRAYLILVVLSYVSVIILVLFKTLPVASLLTFLSVNKAYKTYKLQYIDKRAFVPNTAYLHLMFGTIYLISLL